MKPSVGRDIDSTCSQSDGFSIFQWHRLFIFQPLIPIKYCLVAIKEHWYSSHQIHCLAQDRSIHQQSDTTPTTIYMIIRILLWWWWVWFLGYCSLLKRVQPSWEEFTSTASKPSCHGKRFDFSIYSSAGEFQTSKQRRWWGFFLTCSNSSWDAWKCLQCISDTEKQ